MKVAVIDNTTSIVDGVFKYKDLPEIPGKTTVDVTYTQPRPGPGWSYDGAVFSPGPQITNPNIAAAARATADISLKNMSSNTDKSLVLLMARSFGITVEELLSTQP